MAFRRLAHFRQHRFTPGPGRGAAACEHGLKPRLNIIGPFKRADHAHRILKAVETRSLQRRRLRGIGAEAPVHRRRPVFRQGS